MNPPQQESLTNPDCSFHLFLFKRVIKSYLAAEKDPNWSLLGVDQQEFTVEISALHLFCQSRCSNCKLWTLNQKKAQRWGTWCQLVTEAWRNTGSLPFSQTDIVCVNIWRTISFPTASDALIDGLHIFWISPRAPSMVENEAVRRKRECDSGLMN